MQFIHLLYDRQGFRALNHPEKCFSTEAFRRDCQSRQLCGRKDLMLRVILHTDHFMILPQQASSHDFFQLHFPQSSHITALPLGDGLQNIVFESDPALRELAESLFPIHSLLPDSLLFARYAMRNGGKGLSLLAYYRPEQLQLFVVEDRKLIFANGFSVKDIEDARYFLMAVRQQFSIESVCHFCQDYGDGGEAQALCDYLGSYFRQVSQHKLCDDNALPFIENISDIQI